MAGISDKAVKTNYAENKNRYNDGSELQNKEFSDGSGLEMYDASARGYDQQIGRFHQIDPLAEKDIAISCYAYAGSNPILFNDPTGRKRPPPQAEPYGVWAGAGSPYGAPGGGGGGGSCAACLGPGEMMASSDNGVSMEDQQIAQVAADGAAWAGANGYGPSEDIGGKVIYSASAEGDAGSSAAAYTGIMSGLGQAPSANDPYLVQLMMENSWGGQASNVSASLMPDGMDVSYTATSSGQSYDGYHVSNDITNQFLNLYADYYGSNQNGNGNEEGLTYEKAGSAIGTGMDAFGTAMNTGNMLTMITTGTKIESKIIKGFTGSGTVIGAIAGGVPAAIKLFHGNYSWRNWAAVGLATAGVISEFTGFGEIWDGTVGAGIAAVSLSYDIYDVTHPD